MRRVLEGQGTLAVGEERHTVTYRLTALSDRRGNKKASGTLLAADPASSLAAWFDKPLCRLTLASGDKIDVFITKIDPDRMRFDVQVSGPLPD
jgi:hypothetical protein